MSTEPARAVPKMLVLGTAALAVLVMLASGARTWVTGRVDDPVLSQTAVSVAGSDAASGVLATALVGAAAALAAVTGGRVVRWIGAVSLTASGILGVALTVPALMDPESIVSQHAAAQTGRTGSVDAVAAPTFWVYLSLLAAAVLVLAGGAAIMSVRRWPGLTSRYEAPASGGSTSARATEQESDWDRLSRGEDPT
ncbi:Trp biosynthesis-associated membrane protein [Demetria terragena]|uniref:Trp biosynthesis-associated membrane protein n=1 Tax=Demetria terragena TaxID=63959 RepID=UPI00036F12B1|nr:Trp biosynthesis-associated membrane protein [Demetria terragena]